MKRRSTVILMSLTMTVFLISCATSNQGEINGALGVKHIEEGERASYSGWLLTTEALELLIKEAGRR